MIKNKRMILCGVFAVFVSGCRPFQPPPAEFESYYKPGVDSRGVIDQMVKCGYPNALGFVGAQGRNISLEMKIRAEQCMFRAGFKSRSGFKGICSIKNIQDHPACKQ